MKAGHVIIAVHGIHTGSENWTDKLRRWGAQHAPRLIVEEYHFGKILGVQMYLDGFLGIVGSARLKSFAAWVRKVMGDYPPGTRYSIAAHSYGTWLTHGMLWKNYDIRPDGVALFGSVLSSHFKKTRFPEMFKRRQIKRLLVFWSSKDDVIRNFCNPLFGLSPFGHLGCAGFVDGVGAEDVRQVPTTEEHSGYFRSRVAADYFSKLSAFCLEDQQGRKPWIGKREHRRR